MRQESLHPWPRRLRDALAGLLGPPWTGVARRQRVYRVTLGEARCKRIVLGDARLAGALAERLRLFAAERIYPGLLLQREDELWVEYIEGERATRVDGELVGALARLLAVLMKRAPRRLPLAETPWAEALDLDLRFLGRVGLLEPAQTERLRARARDCAPARVWIGYDCSDAILKNFVWERGAGLRAVDVESLGADQLLGASAAKAAVRWLGGARGEFLQELRVVGAPDFESYFEFVELSFRAFWQKTCCLERKRRYLDPTVFGPFLAR